MPLQVSVFCGEGKTCAHATPILYDFACTPNYTSVDCNYETAQTPIWPSLALRASQDGALNARGEFARVVMRRVKCESCIILSSLIDKCTNPFCTERVHVVDIMSDNITGRSQEELFNAHQLCWHSSNKFVKLAIEQNDVVISNDIANDPRVTIERALPKTHFEVNNVMVVPLVINVGSECRNIGAVLMANKYAGDSICGGFDIEDYGVAHHFFDEMATYLVASHNENRIVLLERTLEQRTDEYRSHLAEISQTRDTFIATMSHEIRTPLNAINGYNEIMLNQMAAFSDVALFSRCLRQQRDAVFQLTQLIANILDFSKLKSKSLKLESRPFDTRACIQRAVNICAPDCYEKNIKLNVVIEPGVPEMVVGDATRLYQVLSNLITNATKYTSHGNIVVTVRVDSLARTEGNLSVLRVSVRDTGRGVPQHLQKLIFQDFSQIRDSITPTAASVQGVGLGLAICRELVTLMQGDIWVESDGRSGSTFHFTAVFRDVETVKRMVCEARECLGKSAVLIVDDVEVNRVTMTKMFIDWGMMPHTCSSLDEAMHMLTSFPGDYFKLAIVDIDIAGASGLTLARRIATDTTLSPLIIIAASSMGRNFEGADEFDAVHVKPLHPDDLLEDIIRLLRSGPMRKPSVPSVTTTPRGTTRVLGAKRAAGILVVDDDASGLMVVQEMILQLGYLPENVKVASSARAALEILERAPTSYCCIFMDLVMPEMDGVECTKIIRQNPARYGAPVIVALSADAVDKTRENAICAGAIMFVSKPISMKGLREVLNQIMKLPAAKKKRRVRVR